MNFAYDGFTHNNDSRCFMFRGMDQHIPTSVYFIEVEISLLAKNKVPIQEAPRLCLELLRTASAAGRAFSTNFTNAGCSRKTFGRL